MRAFTLIEIVFVLLVISFIIVAIFLISLNLSNYNVFVVLEIGKQGEIDLTLKEIENELKSMVYAKNGSYPLEIATSNEIVFYKDFENDGIPEKVRYFVETNNFRKQIFLFNSSTLNYESSPAIDRILVKDLATSTIFHYFDKNFQETSNIAAIRIIKVNLAAIFKFPNKIYENYIIAVPRNLKEK